MKRIIRTIQDLLYVLHGTGIRDCFDHRPEPFRKDNRRYQTVARWPARAATTLLCALGVGGIQAQVEKALPTRHPNPDRIRMRERRETYDQKLHLFPLGAVPPGARLRALKEIEASRSPAAAVVGAWFNIGPSPIHDTTSPDAAGRVSAIAVDPGNGSHWLLGAAQGGIWESKDTGNTWLPSSDDRESLAIGDIAFAPSNPLIVYAGTGEGNFSADSYSGMGLLKSTNGGTTWSLVASSPFQQTAFSRIMVNPADPNGIVVATVRGVQGEVQKGTDIPPKSPPRGIFVSNNGGANWKQTLTGEATDVAVSPATMNDQYAALGEIYGAAVNGLYRTRDGGANWTLINGPWTQAAGGPSKMGRMRVVVAPSDVNRVYVSLASNRDPPKDTTLLGIWMTKGAWDSTPVWTKISGLPSAGNYPWYSQNLLVHPTNPDVLYYAGIVTSRFDGFSWTALQNQHPDQHALAWHASSKSVISTHDGGVSSRPDSGGVWSSHIDGLAITQFYKGSVDPTGSQIVLGGTQDNGTVVNNGSPQWDAAFGGDGYSASVASVIPSNQWAVSHQLSNGQTIYRTQDGQNYVEASAGIDSSTISFFIGFVMHPVNHDIFVAGSTKLWRTTTFFSGVPQWSANSPTLQTATHDDAYITAMAFAPSDAGGKTYAYGTQDGQLRLTTNAGATWNNINSSGMVPGRYVSGLAFSPQDPNELYVTLSGFDEGTPGHPGHVFKTTNALSNVAAWTDISPPVNLPQDCIAIDPTQVSSVWVGSDIGVWNSLDGGKSWTHYGPTEGMPNVAVFDLQFDNAGTLTAFTHGRGAFRFARLVRLPDVNITLCTVVCLFPWIDPESLVVNPVDPFTFTLPLENRSPLATQGLTATLVPSRQVLPAGGSQVQNYGALSVASGIALRNFSFTIASPGAAGGAASEATPSLDSSLLTRDLNEGRDRDRSCTLPSTTAKANVTFALQDNGRPLGSITLPFTQGTLVTALTQDFKAVAVPHLPQGWHSVPRDAWVTSSSPPRNVRVEDDPDSPSDEPPSTSGPVSVSAFAGRSDHGRPLDLYSPVIQVLTENATLKFRHSFYFNPNRARAVLEISINGRDFQDIVESGGSFAQNGYNLPGATRPGSSGPDESLGERAAWSGDSRGYLISKVNLPRRAGGHAVQLRWRLLGDVSTAGEGWYVDDVAVKEYPLTSLGQTCKNQ